MVAVKSQTSRLPFRTRHTRRTVHCPPLGPGVFFSALKRRSRFFPPSSLLPRRSSIRRHELRGVFPSRVRRALFFFFLPLACGERAASWAHRRPIGKDRERGFLFSKLAATRIFFVNYATDSFSFTTARVRESVLPCRGDILDSALSFSFSSASWPACRRSFLRQR